MGLGSMKMNKPEFASVRLGPEGNAGPLGPWWPFLLYRPKQLRWHRRMRSWRRSLSPCTESDLFPSTTNAPSYLRRWWLASPLLQWSPLFLFLFWFSFLFFLCFCLSQLVIEKRIDNGSFLYMNIQYTF